MDDTKVPNEPTVAPGTEQPVTAPEPTPMAGGSGAGKRIPKKALIGGGLAALLLGGTAYGYVGVYKQQPNVVWKESMNNTARGLREFSALDGYGTGGMKYSGSLNVESPVAVTGSVEGRAKDMNSDSSGSVSFSGAKVDFALRTLKAEGSEYPDIYAKVNGLNSFSAMIGPDGAQQLAPYDDKWLFVDHTLLAQAAQSASQNSELANKNITFTESEIRELRQKYADVLSQYVFTADESKSIMQRTGNPTKEDFDGKPTVKYAVNVNKENLKAFVTAMKDATKGTKLETMLTSGDKSLEEALNFDDLLKGIDDMDTGKAKIEVWADKGKRFIRNVRITPEDGEGTVDIGLNYTGGSNYPFYVRISGDDEEAKGGIKLGFSINTDNKEAKLSVEGDIDYESASEQDIKFNFNMTTNPSSDDVNPEKPAGAVNVMTLFNGVQSQLEGLQNPSSYEGFDSPLLQDDMEL